MAFVYRHYCRACKHFAYKTRAYNMCDKCGSANLRRDRIMTGSGRRQCRSCRRNK